MKSRIILYLLGILLFQIMAIVSAAQPGDIHFKQVALKDGLNDEFTGPIIQDKYGYIWIATLGGLNRFNGKSVRRFTHIPGDSTSVPEGFAWAMATDSSGRLWIGYDYGLFEYDFAKDAFIRNKEFAGEYVSEIIAGQGRQLFVRSEKGLFEFDTRQGKRNKLAETNPTLKGHRLGAIFHRGNKLLIGTDNGYFEMETNSDITKFVPVHHKKNFFASLIFQDPDGNVWLGNPFQFLLVRFQPSGGTIQDISALKVFSNAGSEIAFNDIDCDKEGNIWVVSQNWGIIRFDRKTLLHSVYFNNKSESGKSNRHGYFGKVYTAPDGNIWVSTNEGVIYFNPSVKIFSTFYPLPEGEDIPLARSMIEDHTGNLWFTTGEGISRYHPTSRTYITWRNKSNQPPAIYYNSVRAITEDKNGTIWVATGKGINSYTPGQHALKFYTRKDSLPEAFLL